MLLLSFLLLERILQCPCLYASFAVDTNFRSETYNSLSPGYVPMLPSLLLGGPEKLAFSALKLAVHSFPSKIHKVGRAFRSSEVQQTEDEHLPFSSHTLDSSMSTLCQIQAPRGQLSYLELAVFFLRVQLGASEMHGLFSYWARYCDN